MRMQGIKITSLFLLLIVTPFLPQLPSCMVANAAKYGRVVDVTTGKGIPDIAVIHATVIYSGSSFAAGNTLTRQIVHTDINGDFWIPNSWLLHSADIRFRPPGSNAHTGFLMTAFKPGYAFVGDDGAWESYDQLGRPNYLPKSTAIPPSALWLGPIAKIEPLEMKPVDLSLKQAATYYRAILSTGSLPIHEQLHRPDEIELTRMANAYFQPLVCALPEESEMDPEVGGAFASFAIGYTFDLRLSQLEPSAYRDASKHPKVRAKNVCEAMRFAEAHK